MTSPRLLLMFHVKRGGDRIGRQIRTRVRELLENGALAPGARLPSTRALAAHLRVSRTTVVDSLDDLVAEGTLIARRGSGYYAAG